MVIILMGVSGSGKTTVGRKLADELGWSFYEGDDFHSAASIETMGRGAPLTDEDRGPWLAALRMLRGRPWRSWRRSGGGWGFDPA